MASIEQLKERIDLHELAEWLGMVRPGGRGNYLAGWRNEKKPSVSIFDNGRAWKDHTEDKGGSCVDLVMAVKSCDIATAVKILHEFTGLPMDEPERKQERREKGLVDYIADAVLGFTPAITAGEVRERAMEYLTGRKIEARAIEAALKAKTLGFNVWTSPKKPAGEFGHGGPGVSFVVRTLNPGHVAAVETRYLEPQLNGDVKMQCQGDKGGRIWTSDYRKLKSAHTIFIVESPINALSIDSCSMRAGTVAVATLSKANIRSTDWHFLHGKKVVIAMDNDRDETKLSSDGFLPGPSAAWELYEILTAHNIAAHIVDQLDWEHNDVNDMLQAHGTADLRGFLEKTEPWIVPGLWGDNNIRRPGKARLYLPLHDWSQYFRFRAREDFTLFVRKIEKDEEGNEKKDITDLCGFRIASITRVTVAGAASVMSGDEDNQPTTLFSVSVQVARHGNRLIRRVFDDERLHNVDQWKKFGPVFNVAGFSRMVNIMERSAHLGERRAANFVGLCWRDGKAIVNEGQDCYFTEPDKQCPYHNLIFPSGPSHNARTVIEAYQKTFGNNAAALLLVWALGGHLKAFLGFWPHLMMQADKGSGKSTLIKRLERSIGMTMFSGQSLQTEFRLLTSISSTSHPVGWEEISARRQDVIDKAVSMLQESYQYTVTRRGSDMTEFMLAAPVLLAGEDVPVKSLTGKLVRVELSEKGAMLPDELPVFPVRQWLEYLAGIRAHEIRDTFRKAQEWTLDKCSADRRDSGASRMVTNYAALLTAWRLLADFAGIDANQGKMGHDLLANMNNHVLETAQDREPWVWIVETLLSEIAGNHFRHPYDWDRRTAEDGSQHECLCIRISHIMDHISSEMRLRDKWNALPVKSPRALNRQMKAAGVIVDERVDLTIGGRRCCHMAGISLEKLTEFGLHADRPEQKEMDI